MILRGGSYQEQTWSVGYKIAMSLDWLGSGTPHQIFMVDSLWVGHGGPFAPMMVGALGPLVISSWLPSESPGPLGCRVPVDQGASEAMTGDEHG